MLARIRLKKWRAAEEPTPFLSQKGMRRDHDVAPVKMTTEIWLLFHFNPGIQHSKPMLEEIWPMAKRGRLPPVRFKPVHCR